MSIYSCWPTISKMILTIACCGMPPNYSGRFSTSYDLYRQTLQRAQWQAFLDQVRKERAAANVVVSNITSISPYLVDLLVTYTSGRPVFCSRMIWCLLGISPYSLLLVRSSVAFLAVPNLVDFAQFLIIASIGLSLGCVVIGFNSEVDERLSELQLIGIRDSLYAIIMFCFRVTKPASI